MDSIERTQKRKRGDDVEHITSAFILMNDNIGTSDSSWMDHQNDDLTSSVPSNKKAVFNQNSNLMTILRPISMGYFAFIERCGMKSMASSGGDSTFSRIEDSAFSSSSSLVQNDIMESFYGCAPQEQITPPPRFLPLFPGEASSSPYFMK